MNTPHGVAGIDPHKHTATVAVVDVLGVLVTTLSFEVTESGMAELLALLRSTCLSIDRVGVEGSAGMGRPVALAAAGDQAPLRGFAPQLGRCSSQLAWSLRGVNAQNEWPPWQP